jgi:hypothetical protein
MHSTVVLAVGFDSWRLTSQSSELRSAGYVVIQADSIRDAIKQFEVGDFDLVLLGRSISAEDKERLTSLIRVAGSRTPVVCIPNSYGDCNSFAEGIMQSSLSSCGVRCWVWETTPNSLVKIGSTRFERVDASYPTMDSRSMTQRKAVNAPKQLYTAE